MCICVCMYVYIYIYIYRPVGRRLRGLGSGGGVGGRPRRPPRYGRFPKFHRVFFGRDPGTLKSDIVSTKTYTLNLFGFETLKLKIRRLKFWKPTVVGTMLVGRSGVV